MSLSFLSKKIIIKMLKNKNALICKIIKMNFYFFEKNRW